MDEFYIIALIGSVVTMFFAYIIAEKTKSSGYIDTIWSFCVGVFGVLAILIGDGPLFVARNFILVSLVSFWAIRLGWHIFARTSKAPDDPRYAHLRKQWGKNAARNLFIFLQIQAVCAFVLICAIKLGITRPSQEISILDLVATLICIGSIIGETFADNQLRQYSAHNKNGVCNVGLWKYSRHPNYFFEFLFWLGISMFAIDINQAYYVGYFAFLAPILIYWLLNFASGIPPLEAHMLRTRGSNYSQYQKATRPFFPFPKSEASKKDFVQ